MSQLTMHAFKVDVTPPVGDFLCGGLHTRSIGIEQRIFLRGAVLTQRDAAKPETITERVAIAAIDFCYLSGKSHQRLEAAIARGAGVPVSKAVVQSNHVHDVPLIDEEGHSVLESFMPGVHNESYFTGMLAATEKAIADALRGEGTRIAGVSFANCRVSEFAASRRVIGADGVCRVRWSVCRDEAVRSAPEGRFDPLLDAVVFRDAADKPVACWGFYASHPQVSDGRRMISGDTVGIAMDLFEQNNAGVTPVYFTGCGGDITAGKYTTANRPRNRHVFGVRLYDGYQGAFNNAAALPSETFKTISWADHTAEVPLCTVPEPESHFLSTLRDPAMAGSSKYLAAMKVDRLRRKMTSYPFRTSRLRINDYSLFFAPTELVIEYQFHAKQRCNGRASIAAYGDSFLKYVAHDRAFDEGGYEVEPMWSEVSKGIESHVKRAIDRVA